MEGAASLTWNSRQDTWGAGAFVSYIGEVFESSVTNSAGDFFTVEDLTSVNLYAAHRGLLGEGSSIRLGINNATDEAPPLAREAFGFEGELHSNR